MIGRWIFIRDGRLSALTKAVLLLLTILVLVALLPLRLALGAADVAGSLSAREVAGTVWAGEAGGLQAGSLPLGDVYVALRPLPLFLGRVEFAIDRPALPSQSQFHAAVRGGDGWAMVKEANGELELAGLMSPLPVRALTFADVMVEMKQGRCIAAEGMLGLRFASLGPMFPGDTILSGPLRCEGDALFAAMQGPSGTEHLNLTLSPDSKWRADFVLTGLPVEASAPLIDMGFSGRPEGIGLTAKGSF